MPSVRVPEFLPSQRGLHFDNAFPPEPLQTISVGGRQISLGDASKGLCGGMAFTVRDFFETPRPPPSETTPPAYGTPFYEYLVSRLVESFDLPEGPMRYLELMNPLLPDHETELTETGLAPRSRAWVMIVGEWPKIKADLDGGHVTPIGLIKVKSASLSDLGFNHHVLAYGYDLEGDDLTIHLYDPDCPNNDAVAMSLSLGNPHQATPVSYSPVYDPEHPVICFFHTEYQYRNPSGIG